MFADVIAKFLLQDASCAAIRAALAQYQGGPAILSIDLPEDCPLPAIVVDDVSGTPFDCRGSRGTEYQVDVQVFGEGAASKAPIRELARALWLALHRAEMGAYLPSGYEAWGCRAEPPQNTQRGLGLPGCTVTVALRVMESS